MTDKPRRMFPRDRRVSARSFDLVVQRHRCAGASRREAVRLAVVAVYEQVGGPEVPTNARRLAAQIAEEARAQLRKQVQVV